MCQPRFADGTFDFIYVDARHDRLGVLEDLQAWWPKLRRGGLMAGHYYTPINSSLAAFGWISTSR